MSANFHALVKLMNGEELITKVLNDDGAYFTFKDPVLMYRHLTPDGQTWVQCSHWLLFNKVSTIKIHKDRVLALVGDLHENVIINYENFLKGGYSEMDQRNKAEMKEAVYSMVGGANTTYH